MPVAEARNPMDHPRTQKLLIREGARRKKRIQRRDHAEQGDDEPRHDPHRVPSLSVESRDVNTGLNGSRAAACRYRAIASVTRSEPSYAFARSMRRSGSLGVNREQRSYAVSAWLAAPRWLYASGSAGQASSGVGDARTYSSQVSASADQSFNPC